jgi:exosortase/archaeosortase family protein
VFDDLLGGMREAVASGAVQVLSAFGMSVVARGTVIHGSGTPLIIVNECTGVDATILLASAILVFPAGARDKLIGLAGAIGVMMALNFVRILTLIWLGNRAPDWLEFGHLYVWPPIVILVGVGTLLFWADRIAADPS